MTYDDEIKERKEILNVARINLTCETDLLTDALELRIMEQDALILEQSDRIINLRGLLDGGMVELVGELVELQTGYLPYIHCTEKRMEAKALIEKAKEVTDDIPI